jgi:nucleotide-binding universal stress UspA family protein
VLVVANRTLAGDKLREALRRAAADGAELHVVAPILPSRVHYIASDVDTELEEARERLTAALEWARAEGLDADGIVGDPFTAFGAVEDELRAFGADEVIISTLPPGRSNWLEAGILDRLRHELDVPITHVVVDQ